MPNEIHPLIPAPMPKAYGLIEQKDTDFPPQTAVKDKRLQSRATSLRTTDAGDWLPPEII